jgi:murein DD-endopeptidase MepM/ murein hydrolase activator NlpD
MVTPQNNAYDVVYAVGAEDAPKANAEVAPVNAVAQQVSPVSDIIARAIQGSESNAQRYVNAVTANAGAEAARTAGAALQRQRSGKSGFADLAAVVQQGVNIAADTRARSELARNEEERRIAAELKAREQAQRTTDFEIEQQALQAEAPALLRSDVGSVGYTRRMQDLIAKYRDVADPADVVRITGELFAPMQQYNRDLINATQGTIQDEMDSKRSIVISTFMTNYSGLFQQLANANTPDQQTAITNELIANIGTDTADMSAYDRSQVTSTLLTTLSDKYDLSSARFATANATLSDINGYSSDISSALETYEQDRNLSNFRANESRIASQYPNLPSTARYESPDQDLRHALSTEQLTQSVRDARKEGLLSAGESIELGTDIVTDLAYTLYSDPAAAPLYDAVLGSNPEYKQALAVAELLKKQQEVNQTANEAIQSHQLTIQNLSTQNVQQTLSWANSQNEAERAQYTQTVQNLLSIPGVSQDVKAAAQAYIQGQSSGQPIPQATIDSLNQAVIGSREQSIAIVNSQIALETQRISAASAMLRPYGLDTPEGVRQQLANSRESLGTLRTRINTTRQSFAAQQGRPRIPGANGGAVEPNFNMPRLSTATVGNVTAALPFAEGTTAPLTGGDGLYHQFREYYNDGQGGYHQGMDVAVAVGTPITMYNHGTVTFAGDAGTYGNLVEITTTDGYVHRFAHLEAFSVQVGDDVMAGQAFARSGGEPGAAGAGRSGGAHLHWEVRVPSGEAGGGDTMNPLEYTAGLARQAAGRRPRNGQEVSQQGMQLGNGQTLNNSRGAGYSASNPLQQRFASTRSADYQRSADGSANYGYAALASDRSFRIALHRKATEIGIPAQWLADVMGYETGGAFASNVTNQGGSGAVGLIQFMPDTLAAYGYTPEQFATFTNVQQLEVAINYLEDVRKEAGLARWRSPYDVLMAVWGGGNNLSKFVNDPESVRHIGDGDITWQEYTQQLGSNAGRRYQPVYDAPVQHVSFVQGCPTCNALVANGNELYPHMVAAGDVA